MMRLAALARATVNETEERAAQRAKTAGKRVAVFVAAGAIFGLALVYLTIGVFAALHSAFGPITAGLSVAAGLTLIGAVVLLAGLLMTRETQKPIPALPSQDAAMKALMKDAEKLGPALPLAALAMGFLASKR